MKKFLALILAMLLMMSMTVALASGDAAEDPYKALEGLDATVTNTFTITKNYTINGSNATTPVNPADTLTFKVSDAAFYNPGTDDPSPIPTPSIQPVSKAAIVNSADIVVALPAYNVAGIYTYTITEDDTNVAGVTYLSDPLYLKVTIINGDNRGEFKIGGVALRKAANTGDKIKAFDNAYDAGALTIEKEVTGVLGDKDKVWNFTVTLTPPSGDTVKADIAVSGTHESFKEGSGESATDVGTAIAAGTEGWNATRTFALQLVHGQKITLDNLPAGMTYTIVETEAGKDGYTTTPTNDSGTISSDTKTEAKFVNDKGGTIDTGISLETLPYVLVLALALAGTALMIVRRRRGNED